MDKHVVQKPRRGQEILAATPAIDVQILVGAAWPANYQAEPACAVCAESGNQRRRRAPLNHRLTAKK